MFHFNKKHLEDSTIPMWSIKTQGKTFYVNHVDCNLPWSTKETIDNPHTKGSIKIKECVLTIDETNCANISKPTPEQLIRLSKGKYPIRIMYGAWVSPQVKSACERHAIQTKRELLVRGDCGNDFFIAELNSMEEVTALVLATPPQLVRLLLPNEEYYYMLDQTDKAEIWDPYEQEQDD